MIKHKNTLMVFITRIKHAKLTNKKGDRLMNKVSLKRIFVSLVLILFIGLVIILSRIDQREDFRLIQDKAYELKENWTVQYSDINLNNISLPYDINLEPNSLYTIKTILPKLGQEKNTLLLRSSMQDFEVYLDGVLIDEHIELETLGINTPPTSLWVLVTLPDNYEGKELMIKIKTSISAFSGVINSVKLDSREILLYDLIKNQFFGLIIFGLLFVIGSILVLSSFFIKVNNDLRIFYLGLMAIFTSLWILTEARLLQFIIGNRFILGSLAYLMVPLMAIFFALYIREAIFSQEKHKRIVLSIVYVFIILILINILLQIYGVFAYIESMYFTLGVISVGAIIGSYLMIIEIRVHNNQTALRLVKFMLVLFVSLGLEIGSFFIGAFSYISSYLRIGSFIFFLLLMIDTVFYVGESMERRNETLLLEKLAYKDFLTGGLNRTSYEKALELKIEERKTFRLNLLDLNYLKYINDNFGHNKGDEAIKLIYNALETSFNGYGETYRIGGDEFAVILDNTDSELNQKCINQFNLELEEINQKFIHPLDVAIGTDIYTYDQWEQFSKFYHHVDQKMYDNKSRIKDGQKSII
jgi:diguanylate cyclase (GGDEF)-like protein